MKKTMIKLLFKSSIVSTPIRGPAWQLYAVQRGSLKNDLYKDIGLANVDDFIKIYIAPCFLSLKPRPCS
jgi:hypothetical protein